MQSCLRLFHIIFLRNDIQSEMCLILDNFDIRYFYKLFIPIPHKTLCLFPSSPNFQKLLYRSQGELNIHKSI